MAREQVITIGLAAAVANSIALAQTLAGAGPLILNGALVAGGVATIANPAQVTLASTGDFHLTNFTITGTDWRGAVVTEVLAGPNNNTVTSVNTYATVTSIVASGAVGTNITAGNAVTGASVAKVLDHHLNPFEVSMFLEFVGTANATVQYTGDPVLNAANLDALNWFNHSDLTAKSSLSQGTLISPVEAVRVIYNSGTGVVTLRIRQAGIRS